MAFINEDVAIAGGRGGYAYPVYGGGGYGYGAEGGSFGIWGILLAVIVLFLLFKDGFGKGHGGYGDGIYVNSFDRFGGGYGGNCAYDCKPKMVIDMSNCEVDKDLWKVDADLKECCCKQIEATHCEGEKTRALIEANYIQDLRDKLAEKAVEVQSLKTQAYTDAKFDSLYGKLNCYDRENDKEYCKLNNKIDMLICETPKRPPIWCEGITPNTHHTDCRHDDFPRRGFRNDCCNDCNSCC